MNLKVKKIPPNKKAQPVTFAHHLMAYFEMFKRDLSRLRDCRKRTKFLLLLNILMDAPCERK